VRNATPPQAVSRRLSLLAGEVASTKARKQMVRDGLPAADTPGSSGGFGSIEHTVKVRPRAAGRRAGAGSDRRRRDVSW
jgi:hypothetical protein